METLRKQLEKVLGNGPLSLREISRSLHVSEKEALEHLKHLKRSGKRGVRLKIVPPQCKKCGYEFKRRQRLNKPSRCPKCKGSYIAAPLFWLPAAK